MILIQIFSCFSEEFNRLFFARYQNKHTSKITIHGTMSAVQLVEELKRLEVLMQV